MMGVQFGPSEDDPGEAGQTGQRQLRVRHLRPQPAGPPATPTTRRRTTTCPCGPTSPPTATTSNPCAAGDYIVEVDIPDDPVGGGRCTRSPQEEDVNVFDGDAYLPQENFQASLRRGGDPPDPATPQPEAGVSRRPSRAASSSPCAGRAAHRQRHGRQQPELPRRRRQPVRGPGQARPATAKLITVRDRPDGRTQLQPVHPGPAAHALLGPDHQRPRPDPRQAQRQLRRGAGPALRPGRPLRLGRPARRHRAHRLQRHVRGARALHEHLQLPAAGRPVPEHVPASSATTRASRGTEPDYNPRFRTIAANFQGWPGLYTVTDTAPTQTATVGLSPDGTFANPTQCDLGASLPAAVQPSTSPSSRSTVDAPRARAPSPSRAPTSAPRRHAEPSLRRRVATTTPSPPVPPWMDGHADHLRGADDHGRRPAPVRCGSPRTDAAARPASTASPSRW